MYFTDDRYRLRVEINAKECQIPDDERARMQESLAELGEAVKQFPASSLYVTVTFHPNSQLYNLQLKLKLPGRTLTTADEDTYLDTAYQRGVRKLLQKVTAYKEHPDDRAVELARRRQPLERNLVAPEGADVGPLADAVGNADYHAFRTALSGYEDWLRNRIGRWVQRYPDADARIGKDLLLGDILEEVYLNAFERYHERKMEVPLHNWLENLIDPSLRALIFDPEEEKQAVSFARTMRQEPLR
jgi:ribosome-associated translation inhibitor RaiA